MKPKKEKKVEQLAFPINFEMHDKNNNRIIVNGTGMSKRFYAACVAMQGLISKGDLLLNLPADNRMIIADAYMLADKLIEQENNE